MERALYGWAIEFGADAKKLPRVSFFRRGESVDLAYVEQRAADLHGVIVHLFRDQREMDHDAQD